MSRLEFASWSGENGLGKYEDASDEAKRIYECVFTMDSRAQEAIGNLHVARYGNFIFPVFVMHGGGSRTNKSLSLDALVEENGTLEYLAGFGSGQFTYDEALGEMLFALAKAGVSTMDYLHGLDAIPGLVGELVHFKGRSAPLGPAVEILESSDILAALEGEVLGEVTKKYLEGIRESGRQFDQNAGEQPKPLDEDPLGGYIPSYLFRVSNQSSFSRFKDLCQTVEEGGDIEEALRVPSGIMVHHAIYTRAALEKYGLNDIDFMPFHEAWEKGLHDRIRKRKIYPDSGKGFSHIEAVFQTIDLLRETSAFALDYLSRDVRLTIKDVWKAVHRYLISRRDERPNSYSPLLSLNHITGIKSSILALEHLSDNGKDAWDLLDGGVDEIQQMARGLGLYEFTGRHVRRRMTTSVPHEREVIVFKIGGSFLDAEFEDRLRKYIAAAKPELMKLTESYDIIPVPGGGPAWDPRKAMKIKYDISHPLYVELGRETLKHNAKEIVDVLGDCAQLVEPEEFDRLPPSDKLAVMYYVPDHLIDFYDMQPEFSDVVTLAINELHGAELCIYMKGTKGIRRWDPRLTEEKIMRLLENGGLEQEGITQLEQILGLMQAGEENTQFRYIPASKLLAGPPEVFTIGEDGQGNHLIERPALEHFLKKCQILQRIAVLDAGSPHLIPDVVNDRDNYEDGFSFITKE